MLKSMTGYGKAECELSGKKVTIELKSLNSKQVDINTRLPFSYNSKDLDIRSMISKTLERGKFFFSLNEEDTGDEPSYTLNKPLAKSYFKELKNLGNDLGLPPENDWLYLLTRLPDVLKQDDHEVDDYEWQIVSKCIEEVIAKVDQFRENEGEELENDIEQRIHKIGNNLSKIAPFESKRIETLKDRFRKHLNEIADENSVDENRFEQELIYYLEKIDITEEKVRLKNHLGYFLETMHEETSQGKKLGFISQEIGREINTLGSKANDSDIQKLVVQMKDELEKIKEQMMNIL